jgi:nucleotide-binding universal stress UspA family protein
MRTILVPLDGSPLAELGLRAATRMAVETGAELVLLCAVPFLSAAPGEEREYERTEATAYLEEMRQRVADRGLAARTLVLPGDPVRAILFAAEVEGADLISMATHGHGGAMDRLLGSVTAAVLRAADRPMLITRGDAPLREEAVPMRTILVGLDGTPFAEAALSYLAESGLGRAASTLLVQAVEAAPIPPAVGLVSEQALDRLAKEAQQVTERHLQEAVAYLQATAAAKLPMRRSRARALGGEAASILVDVAGGEHVDLLVLMTHGRRGMDRLLHGSVAQAVLRHSKAPVLILHGSEAEAPVAEIVAATHG